MGEASDDDLKLALELADLADGITMSRYRAEDLRVETKPDSTPVTEADRAVELALRERLEEIRPGDAVIGEEFGDAPRVSGQAVAPSGHSVAPSGQSAAPSGQSAVPSGQSAAPSGRRWIIDPIDGTKSYMRGMPTWSTLLALEDDQGMALGLVSMPALERRWWAVRGGGAFADGTPIRVSSVGELGDAQLCWSGIQEWDEVGRPEAIIALARACWRSRGVGDAWQYMLVAEGAAEIALDPSVSLWDVAPLQVIIEEAGGAFSDLHGVRTADGGSGLATNGLVHQAALEIVGLEPR